MDKDDSKLWQEMPVQYRKVIPPATHPHFQILLSGVMAADAFLIDTDSGSIWMLVKVVKEGTQNELDYYMWEVMPVENSESASTTVPRTKP